MGCSFVSLWLVVFGLSMIDFLLFDHFFAFATATFATSTCIANLRTAYGVSTDKLERSQAWKTTEDRELESATMRDRKLEGTTMKDHNLERSVTTTREPRTGKERDHERPQARPQAGKSTSWKGRDWKERSRL